MHDELSMYLCNIPLEFDDFDFLQNQAKLPQIVVGDNTFFILHTLIYLTQFAMHMELWA